MLPYQLHQKLRQAQQQTRSSSSASLSVLKGLPFWIWDKQEHRQQERQLMASAAGITLLAFQPRIGKNIHYLIMRNYFMILYYTNYGNFKDKHLWVKKATGLGVTEFMLRTMAWLCTRDETFDGSQMCIVTGPNIEMATKLIKRMKGIFEPKLGLTFSNKETVLELNGCTIEAYPSNHIDSYRALDNPKFILLDESDFFRKGEQEEVRYVSERYIGKSDPYIVMVSTPNNPGGLFYQIEQEPEDTCLYKRLKMDYHYGLGKIYTQEEIDKASPLIRLFQNAPLAREKMFDSLSEFMKERNQNMLNSFEAKLRESVQILIDLRLDRINKVGKLEPTDEDTQLGPYAFTNESIKDMLVSHSEAEEDTEKK